MVKKAQSLVFEYIGEKEVNNTRKENMRWMSLGFYCARKEDVLAFAFFNLLWDYQVSLLLIQLVYQVLFLSDLIEWTEKERIPIGC